MLHTITETKCNGHSMTGPLQRVLVCSPSCAGWSDPARAAGWQQLGFLHAPDFGLAEEQHGKLLHEIASAGTEILELPPASDLSLDAVYAHDSSLATDHGMVIMRTGKSNRVVEGAHHREFFAAQGIPILGEIAAPGTTEAGDIVWLDEKTLLVGHSYRTNAAGIAQLRDLLAPHGVEVVSAPLPHGSGPAVCLHLMSLISLLDEKTALVDLAWLAVETVELLGSRGYSLIEIDASERDTLACNVLALGDRRLLALEENRKTSDRLRAAGFAVRTFPGSELCINGGGGPTCLTRPLLRG
ncbi:MAG TPA: arginine deiminase family protein [Candidatus Sulfotelmatobacter sp.]|nr:arginine deiminase family protein [Candidatus Sulfotelmatobacter sp.]